MGVLLQANVDGVLTLTLNRPDRLNAFDAALHAALRDAIRRAAIDDAVKAVVLTGAGRAFSSGQDLADDLPRDTDGRIFLQTVLERDYNPLIVALHGFPKPTIAALNGLAVGAAMNIALACDIVLAARSAMLQEAFVKIGLIPDAGGTWLLPRLVGTRRALALMLTGDPVSAEEAHRLGLVYRLYDDARFRDGVAAFAAALARGPSVALRLTKEAVRSSEANGLEAQLSVEARLQGEAGLSADFVEGVAAFREKRPPRFTGH